MKIGITGQSGFVGTHLYNYLGLQENIERVPFDDTFFQDEKELERFVSSCDVIVHLAAMNRHNDPEVIYKTNMELVQKLIAACERTDSRPHVLFASSIQESRNNPYGRSKREGRKLLEEWARRNNAFFTGLIIPNVFGPYGKPYHNSFVATFCHQLTHQEEPKVEIDSEVELIYVGKLVKEMYIKIKDKSKKRKVEEYRVPYSKKIKVSKVLEILRVYKEDYFEKGIIPDLSDPFGRDLFNTFVGYIDHRTFFPFPLQKREDKRGVFAELIKLKNGGQISFSTTKSGITRGNHFHTRKAERFVVVRGKARIEIRRTGTNEVLSFELDGENPSFVDMPVWYTHNITNIGKEDLYTVFWISEFYNPEDPDTFYEEV